MEWNSERKTVIVECALIGGSYAKALERLGYHIGAVDNNESTIAHAPENGDSKACAVRCACPRSARLFYK